MSRSPLLYTPETSLLVTGGGTGGHVVPALELAKAHLKSARGPVLYMGSPDSLEERLAKSEGIPFIPVPSGGFVGKPFWGKFRAIGKVAGGLIRAFVMLGTMRPGLVIGTGGYVQIPVVAAALLRRRPVVLLEPNRVTGLSNRLFWPWVARTVHADLEENSWGIPVAQGICGPPPERERFTGETVKIMVIGGSQGARSINENLPGILREVRDLVPEIRLEVFHQSGERWKEETAGRYRSLEIPARVEGFLPELSSYFRDQTLVISRAGAMTIAEVTASGTPAIVIPFPFSAGGHQEQNARAMEEAGAGVFWGESTLGDRSSRAKELVSLLSDGDALFAMASRAWKRSTAVPAGRWLLALGNQDKEKPVEEH